MSEIDTVYEWAGFQAAMALFAALSGLGVPLLVALGGVAWRFMRVAEDGLARPLAVHFGALIVVWWLLSPTALPDDRKAPRFVAWVDSASDAFTSRAIGAVHRRFLNRPFEFERMAAMCGMARVYCPTRRENLHAFFEACTRPAIAALDEPAGAEAELNPLGSRTGLPYGRFTFTWRAGAQRGEVVRCDQARARLMDDIRMDVNGQEYHREALAALREAWDFPAAPVLETYIAQVVRNEWNGTAGNDSEMALVRAAVGRYAPGDPMQDTVRTERWAADADARLALRTLDRAVNPIVAVWGAVLQTGKTSMEAKQRYYMMTTLAPQLYGLAVMLLIALFPIAGLWALLPGRWTSLVHWARMFAAVKLWPVGWAILSKFSASRPAAEAFSVPGQPDVGTADLFVGIVTMYGVVPFLAFAVVNIAVAAAAVPFREAATAGGNPVKEIAAAAR